MSREANDIRSPQRRHFARRAVLLFVTSASLLGGGGLPEFAGESAEADPQIPAEAASRLYRGVTLNAWRDRMKEIDPGAPLSPDVFQGLRDIIVDPEAPWFTRRQAAMTLARIGPHAAALVPDLIRLIDEPSTEVETSARLWAIKALSFFGSAARDATPRIVELFERRDEQLLVRLTAAETLARIGAAHPLAIPALIAAIRGDGDSSVAPDSTELRATAIEVLQLAPAPSALPALMAASEDPEERIRHAAVTTIGALGASAEPAIETLAARILFDESRLVRDAAGQSLARVGVASIPALTQLLNDGNPDIRLTAIQSFGRLGMIGRPHTDRITPRFDDPVPEVAVAALQAHWRIAADPKPLQSRLLSALSHPDRQVRKAASDTLIAMRAAALPLRPDLERLAASGAPDARAAATRVLNSLGAE